MLDPFAHWYLLPTGILIATVYSSTGISGATFWTFVYVVALDLDPRLGFWLALLSMLFGSTGGLFAHRRGDSVRWPVARRLALTAVPSAAAGALLTALAPVRWLLLAFSVFLVLQSMALLRSSPARRSPVPEPLGYAAVGGFLTGLISVGTGAVLLPRLLRRPDVPRPVDAAGTTLAVVFTTSLTAAALRLRPELTAVLETQWPAVASMLMWVIPGVLLGSQVGPVLARRFDPDLMRRYVAVVLMVLGGLMALRSI